MSELARYSTDVFMRHRAVSLW